VRRAWIALAAALAAVCALTGVALGATGVVDVTHEHREVVLPHGVAPYSTCPATPALGWFHGGDRVYATGRDDSGDWIQVRAPFDVTARVWVRRKGVDPDRTFAKLPVVACVTTSTTTTVSTTTSTSVPTTGTSSSTAPSSTSTTVAATAVPTTTRPSDTKPPIIGTPVVDPPRIHEDVPDCAVFPHTATVTVRVVDTDSGVADVVLGWSVGDTTHSVRMTASGDTWSAKVGPFPGSTLAGGEAPISLSITARDRAGNMAIRADASVMLRDCGP